MSPSTAPHQLTVENFAHLEKVDIEFGDLTVLVGAQGTGKSLFLQWLKLALDPGEVVAAIRAAGQDLRAETLIDLVFGLGMAPSWRANDSRVTMDGKKVTPQAILRAEKQKPKAFFMPAHRAMLVSKGWASPFGDHGPDVPAVARLFSQNLFNLLSNRRDVLFPLHGKLKKVYRDVIDSAVFHGGSIGLEVDAQLQKQLKLRHRDSVSLPYMTWTAGQREFTPLLLGLYHLLPSGKLSKQPGLDWVIIEEPEMGLHPRAINAFMLIVLDLLWRGYRVVLSTHSPLVLDVAWALRHLGRLKASPNLVADAFGVKRASLKEVSRVALGKTFKTYVLEHRQNGKVTSKDISGLDPLSENEDEASWGGLTSFSTQFAGAVRAATLGAEP